MSRVFPKSRSLEEILQYTSVMVLHVRKSAPFRTVEARTFPDEEKPIPDFTYAVNHYQIIEVIHNINAWELNTNDTIQVFPFNYESLLNDHKKYYQIGLSKSTYQFYYEEGISLEEVDEAIIFISPNWSIKSLEYVVNGAIHDAEDIQRIRQILSSK